MKLSQLFKKKKSDKIKMPIGRIISNNVFMLRMAHRSVPGLLGSEIIFAVLGAVTSFLTYTYILRYALNGIAEGKSFFGVCGNLGKIGSVKRHSEARNFIKLP